jgi:hypothetical protein
MRSRLRSKLENILQSLDIKTKKSTLFTLNQVRKLRDIYHSINFNVKNYFFPYCAMLQLLARDGLFIKTVLRLGNPIGIHTLFTTTS